MQKPKTIWLYLCYPFADYPERRRRQAAIIANHLIYGRQDVAVFVPHLAFMYLDEGINEPLPLRLRRDAIEMISARKGELVICGDSAADSMKVEIEYADKHGMPMTSLPGLVLESWGIFEIEDTEEEVQK